MNDIGPGDLVICVDASPGYANGRPLPLVEGRLYTILSISTTELFRCKYGYPTVKIKEVDGQFSLRRFRPIPDSENKIIEELGKVPELEDA